MTSGGGRGAARCAVWLGLGLGLGSCAIDLVEITEGLDIDPGVRPGLAADGSVVAAEARRLLVGDGTILQVIDLTPFDLSLEAHVARPSPDVQVRSAGDIVFIGTRSPAKGCPGSARGAYRLSRSAPTPDALYEFCHPSEMMEEIRYGISMSPNGTVAFSTLRERHGAIWRGPAVGPVSVLRSGTLSPGPFANSGPLDVNDAGTVVVEMEYSRPPLERGILAFDAPEQDLDEIDSALEGMGVGSPVALSAGGRVAYVLRGQSVILATLTPYGEPKVTTLVADLEGPYCKFGAVDINAAGFVTFEAALDGTAACAASGRHFDGIFTGPDPRRYVLVQRGDPALGAHRDFDDIVLGQFNDNLQVSFITTRDKTPVKVWRGTVRPF